MQFSECFFAGDFLLCVSNIRSLDAQQKKKPVALLVIGSSCKHERVVNQRRGFILGDYENVKPHKETESEFVNRSGWL